MAEVSFGQATTDRLGHETPHRIPQDELGFALAPALLFRQGKGELDHSPVCQGMPSFEAVSRFRPTSELVSVTCPPVHEIAVHGFLGKGRKLLTNTFALPFR